MKLSRYISGVATTLALVSPVKAGDTFQNPQFDPKGPIAEAILSTQKAIPPLIASAPKSPPASSPVINAYPPPPTKGATLRSVNPKPPLAIASSASEAIVVSKWDEKWGNWWWWIIGTLSLWWLWIWINKKRKGKLGRKTRQEFDMKEHLLDSAWLRLYDAIIDNENCEISSRLNQAIVSFKRIVSEKTCDVMTVQSALWILWENREFFTQFYEELLRRHLPFFDSYPLILNQIHEYGIGLKRAEQQINPEHRINPIYTDQDKTVWGQSEQIAEQAFVPTLPNPRASEELAISVTPPATWTIQVQWDADVAVQSDTLSPFSGVVNSEIEKSITSQTSEISNLEDECYELRRAWNKVEASAKEQQLYQKRLALCKQLFENREKFISSWISVYLKAYKAVLSLSALISYIPEQKEILDAIRMKLKSFLETNDRWNNDDSDYRLLSSPLPEITNQVPVVAGKATSGETGKASVKPPPPTLTDVVDTVIFSSKNSIPVNDDAEDTLALAMIQKLLNSSENSETYLTRDAWMMVSYLTKGDRYELLTVDEFRKIYRTLILNHFFTIAWCTKDDIENMEKLRQHGKNIDYKYSHIYEIFYPPTNRYDIRWDQIAYAGEEVREVIEDKSDFVNTAQPWLVDYWDHEVVRSRTDPEERPQLVEEAFNLVQLNILSIQRRMKYQETNDWRSWNKGNLIPDNVWKLWIWLVFRDITMTKLPQPYISISEMRESKINPFKKYDIIIDANSPLLPDLLDENDVSCLIPEKDNWSFFYTIRNVTSAACKFSDDGSYTFFVFISDWVNDLARLFTGTFVPNPSYNSQDQY